MRLINQLPSPSNRLGIVPQKNADKVFLLFDPAFKVRNRFRRAKHQLLSLPDVQHGGGAAIGKDLGQTQGVVASRQSALRDLEFKVKFTLDEIVQLKDVKTIRQILKKKSAT